jgi:hypothetical protein
MMSGLAIASGFTRHNSHQFNKCSTCLLLMSCGACSVVASLFKFPDGKKLIPDSGCGRPCEMAKSGRASDAISFHHAFYPSWPHEEPPGRYSCKYLRCSFHYLSMTKTWKDLKSTYFASCRHTSFTVIPRLSNQAFWHADPRSHSTFPIDGPDNR